MIQISAGEAEGFVIGERDPGVIQAWYPSFSPHSSQVESWLVMKTLKSMLQSFQQPLAK